MTWLDDLAKFRDPHNPVKVGVIVDYRPGTVRVITVSWDGGDPAPATWTAGFNTTLVASQQAVIGMKVLVVLPDGQPIIVSQIIGS